MKKLTVTVKENEEKVLSVIRFPDDESALTLTVRLKRGASVVIVGVFFGEGENSFVFNTDVIHEGLHTKSLTFIRGVFRDRSQFSNDGMVRMMKGAKNANGYFNSKVLLFDHAKGRSVPSLEIDENEVKAGHGSTIGRPDENQLFYLRSRGLSEEEASRLIISGFFQPAIELMLKKDRELALNRVKKLSVS